MDPNNAWQAYYNRFGGQYDIFKYIGGQLIYSYILVGNIIYYNRFGGQEQGMVGNPASLLLAHQQLREAANQVGCQD